MRTILISTAYIVSNFAPKSIVSKVETMNNKIYTQSYDVLRSWLKSKREEKGLTIRQLADLLGRHHSIIGKVEQSRRKIDVIELLEYCEVLEVDPHEAIQVLQDVKGKHNY